MNAKQRYRARRAAEHRERKQFAQRINRAFTRLSEGCSDKVLRATSLGSLRDSNTGGSVCLPEVALYAAGHRTVRKNATHIIK